jgi:adenylate cyclase
MPRPRVRQADAYATPLVASGAPLLSGVEIQAHVIASVLSGRSVDKIPVGALIIALTAVSALSTVLFRPWRPLRSAGLGAALAFGILTGAWSLFRYVDLWLPPGVLLMGIALAYIAEGGRAFIVEQTLRRRINRGFGHYVSPHVVQQIMADPHRLKLVGERRKVSILFGDLAGFTTIAEKLAPEEVVEVLNRYLSSVTRGVMESGGTVVKYLGDGMMAMWGAPLDDSDQARHACESAVAMQAAVAALRAELVAMARPPVHMRIGVHSGEAVVGNMGSDARFDYTAAGDTVNLASRLEGANKLYGTGILVSEATARLAGPPRRFRRVDRVLVKGKHEPTELFSPECDANVSALIDEAVGSVVLTEK